MFSFALFRVLDCVGLQSLCERAPFGLDVARLFFDLHRTFFVRAGVLRGGYPQQKTRDLPCPSLPFSPVGCLGLRVKGDGELRLATVNQIEKEKTKQIDIDTTAMQSENELILVHPYPLHEKTPKEGNEANQGSRS